VVQNKAVSIVRRIKREARNNPAKAAVLAGLLGLALYSWAPLVMGWLGAGGDASPSASRSGGGRSESNQKDSDRPASSGEAVSEERPSWNELQEWQESSPWTTPIEMAEMRDPFRPVPQEEEMVEESDDSEESSVPAPEQMLAGVTVQLTGTIVSPRRRVALLDGQAYGEGDVIRVEYLGTTWELEIRRIEPSRVTLGWQSIERELAAPERQPVGRIESVKHPG